MRNYNRAKLKRERRRFKVGELVTWGKRAIYCEVLEIKRTGLIVNGGALWPRYFVAFDHNNRQAEGGRGPIFKQGEK